MYGVNTTATTHDARSAIATTQKMPPAYSPTAGIGEADGKKASRCHKGSR